MPLPLVTCFVVVYRLDAATAALTVIGLPQEFSCRLHTSSCYDDYCEMLQLLVLPRTLKYIKNICLLIVVDFITVYSPY